MAKVRVYDIAREVNVDSKTLLARMKTAGIEAASHQSTLSDDEVVQVRGLISDGKAGAVAETTKSAKPKVVIRRRRKAKEPEAGAETQEAARVAEGEAAAAADAAEAVASA